MKITQEGEFYKLTNANRCCEACRQHEYVIVQKLGAIYGMHTYVATSVPDYVCIHTWRNRASDPICLSGYSPTSVVPDNRTDTATLANYLALTRRSNLRRRTVDTPQEIPVHRIREIQDRIIETIPNDFQWHDAPRATVTRLGRT